MGWEAVQPDGVARPQAPYSPVVVSGDLVVTAGQVAFDADGALVPGGVEEQTRQVFANVRACLESVGCSLADVFKVNAFLVDLADFEVFNAVYRETFTAPYPVRTTVQAGLAPGLLVEVEVQARRPS
jgi:2-iminobutanoate/2-iminopropanoate deaminase